MIELDRKEAMDIVRVLSQVEGYLMRSGDDFTSQIFEQIVFAVDLLVSRLDDEH
jgi:hypothetical protein